MKSNKFIRVLVTALVACGLALALAACSSSSVDDRKAAQENRQYMALLNSQMADLQTVMDDFQGAVSDQNLVAMESQLANAESIKSEIEKQEATEGLSDVKDQYVDALSSLNEAMRLYVDAYERVQDGTLSGDELAEELEDIQDVYDAGISKIEEADKTVASLAGE